MRCTRCYKRVWWWQTPGLQLWEFDLVDGFDNDGDDPIHLQCKTAK